LTLTYSNDYYPFNTFKIPKQQTLRRAKALTMMLALPPLQIPTHNAHAQRRREQAPTNTLHITHPSRTFFTPRSLSILRAAIAAHAPNGILSFSPLKSLRRVIIVFATAADARAVRNVLDGAYNLSAAALTSTHLDVEGDTNMGLSSSESSCGEEMECEAGAPIRCYYGNETTVLKEKKLLKPEAQLRKREFEGELAPHGEEGEEKIPLVRRRSSSLVLLESDGRKPGIEVEEF